MSRNTPPLLASRDSLPDKQQQSAEVNLILGHEASWRKKPTAQNYTHNWIFYVKGEGDCPIEHFVEKVVIHLHKSFSRPRRTLKKPPYQVSLKGYGNFTLNVEVHLKTTNEKDNVIHMDYDLILPDMGKPSISLMKIQNITLSNISDEFKQKVLQGGGKLNDVGKQPGRIEPGSSESGSKEGSEVGSSKAATSRWNSEARKQLFEKINAIRDLKLLQTIVDTLEQKDNYHISEAENPGACTFNFDLFKLDESILDKLNKMVE